MRNSFADRAVIVKAIVWSLRDNAFTDPAENRLVKCSASERTSDVILHNAVLHQTGIALSLRGYTNKNTHHTTKRRGKQKKKKRVKMATGRCAAGWIDDDDNDDDGNDDRPTLDEDEDEDYDDDSDDGRS